MQGLTRVLEEGSRSTALLSHRLEIKGPIQPTPRYGHAMVAVSVAGKTALVLFGGIDRYGNYREEVDALNTATFQWKLLTTSEHTHDMHLSVMEAKEAKNKKKDHHEHSLSDDKASHREVTNNMKLNIGADLSFGKKDLHVHSASTSVTMQAPKKVGTEGNEALGRSCSAMVVYKDSLYLFGGKNKFFLNDLWRFGFDDLEWKRLEFCGKDSHRPCRRMGHSAVVYKDAMWIFGGFCAEGEAVNDLWCYDFEKASWTKIEYQGEATARYQHTAVVAGDSMYVFGGKGNFTSAEHPFLRFDFGTKTFSSLNVDHGPSPRWGHAAGVNSRAMYIYGGFGEYKGYLSDCFEYNFASGKWENSELQGEAGTPDSARELHSLVFLGNSRAYLFGGIGPDGVLGDVVEIWDCTDEHEGGG